MVFTPIVPKYSNQSPLDPVTDHEAPPNANTKASAFSLISSLTSFLTIGLSSSKPMNSC